MIRSRLYTALAVTLAVICGIAICAALIITPIDRPSDSSATKTDGATKTDAQEETASEMNSEVNLLILVSSSSPLPENYQITLGDIADMKAAEIIIPSANAFTAAAEKAGYPVVIRSAYRTAEEQQEAFDEYYNDYIEQGLTSEEAYANAEKWAMKPGTSEHQTGLALDINPTAEDEDAKTAAYEWLKNNCAAYGFILRYPKDKTEITGVSPERWHFRYVGKEAAEYIMANGLTLEEYIQQVTGEAQ